MGDGLPEIIKVRMAMAIAEEAGIVEVIPTYRSL
jgi:hypothetical protein